MICNRATYRLLMHDTDSYDGDVDAALAEAQDFLEEETDRKFELGTFTEVLRIDKDGYAYPSASPIVSVATPINSTVDGNRVLVGSYYNLSISPSDTTSVTYTGGYAADALPRSLVRLVARIAYSYLKHETSTDFPEGVKSVTVGDVSYTLSDAANSDDRIMRDVRRWDRKRLEWY